MYKQGFTLIELIVVVVIVGILATFAVPQYLGAVEKAHGAKAKNALALIMRAQKLYHADSDDSSWPAAETIAAGETALNSYIEMGSVANDALWIYSIDGSGNATATRVNGTHVNATITLGPDSGDFNVSDNVYR